MKKEDLGAALTAALEQGIRHVDTSFVFQNEEIIGKALIDWFSKGGKREDIFVTTKVHKAVRKLNIFWAEFLVKMHVTMTFISRNSGNILNGISDNSLH